MTSKTSILLNIRTHVADNLAQISSATLKTFYTFYQFNDNCLVFKYAIQYKGLADTERKDSLGTLDLTLTSTLICS